MHVTHTRLLPIVALLLLTVACGNQRQVGTPRQEEQVRRIGVAAAGKLTDTLFSQVQAAIQQGGPAYAVDFCATEALPLTAAVAGSIGGEVQIKRTSFRYRNPRNAPDVHEEAALRYFEQALATQGSLPADYVQLVNVSEYRYYRPIIVSTGCLTCHGDAAQLDPALRQVIQSRYPQDQAMGYQAGDLRGVVRVAVPTGRLR